MRNAWRTLVIGIALAVGAGCARDAAPKPTTPSKKVSALEAAAPPAEPSRAAANHFLAAVFRGTRPQAYALVHSKTRTAASEARFASSLDLIDATYGRPILAVLKSEAILGQPSKQRDARTVRQYTYALTTSKHRAGTHFAVVRIAADGADVAVLSYEVMTFPGEKPPWLGRQ